MSLLSFHCSEGSECYIWRAMASEPTAQTCPGCGATVDTTEAEPLARIACPTCGKEIRGERAFGHFVVVETLGGGGVGTLYKARRMGLDRLGAAKLVGRGPGGRGGPKTLMQRG